MNTNYCIGKDSIYLSEVSEGIEGTVHKQVKGLKENVEGLRSDISALRSDVNRGFSSLSTEIRTGNADMVKLMGTSKTNY